MDRVSLIPLVPDSQPWPTDRLASLQARLERAGYAVTVEGKPTAAAASERLPGLVARAVMLLRSASGSFLILVDLAMAYSPEDVLAVANRLAVGDVSLVIGARRGRWLASAASRLTGTADPSSGLAGLTFEAARDAERSFAPVGSRFVAELLARVNGQRSDVEVGVVAPSARRWSPMDDIRHAKRVADDRLGNLSRLLQFCFVGASGMVVDLSTYAALQAVLTRTSLNDRDLFLLGSSGNSISVAVVVAAVLAIATAMTWNFSLNRRLTFNDARRGSIARQYFRYVLSNVVGCGVSLAFRLALPSAVPFFARHRLAAAVAGIVAATGISFSMARWFVFQIRVDRSEAATGDDFKATRLDPMHAPDFPAMHQTAIQTPAESC